MLCIGPLRSSLNLQQSLPGRQKPCCFSHLNVSWVPFWPLCYKPGNSACALDPTSLRRNPTTTAVSLQTFNYCPWEPSQPSHITTLPTSHIVVKWFLLSVCDYKASLLLVFSWFFRILSVQFNCNCRLILRRGSHSFHLLLHHFGS